MNGCHIIILFLLFILHLGGYMIHPAFQVMRQAYFIRVAST